MTTPIFVLRGLGMDDCFKKWKMEVENSQCKFFLEYKFASPEEVHHLCQNTFSPVF